jgi:tetratricopeptide (TPR) repeat protein
MVRLVLVVVMLVATGGCAWNQDPVLLPPQDERAIPEIAESLYREKRYPEALTSLLAADPKSFETLENRRLLWRINDRLVTVQWYFQKATIALVKGDKEAARLEIDRALKLYPGHAPSLKLRKSLDVITIEKPIPKVVSKTPSPSPEALIRADYFFALGRSYFNKGELELAKRSWREGLGIVPSHGEIKGQLVRLLVNQGLRFFGQGDIGASIVLWEEAFLLGPDDPEIKGYLDKARKAIEELRSIDS